MRQFLQISTGILLIISTIIYGCIPVEDLVDPQIEEWELETEYFYQDTLEVKYVVRDNTSLDSLVISIKKTSGLIDTVSDWSVQDIVIPKGRKYFDTARYVVPNFVSNGDYELTIQLWDGDKNEVDDKREFTIKGDTVRPVFQNLKITNLNLTEGSYEACRASSIEFSGEVIDNIWLYKMGFNLYLNNKKLKGDLITFDPATIERRTSNIGDTVSVASFFQKKISIPVLDLENQEIADNSLLSLELIAVDTFDNISSKTVSILVDCDDKKPTIEFGSSFPSLDEFANTSVTQGGRLYFNSILVHDNKMLSSIDVYYKKKEEDLSEANKLITTIVPNSNSYTIEGLSVSVEKSSVLAPIGELRELIVIAKDTVGFQTISKVSFDIIQDLPPVVSFDNLMIDGVVLSPESDGSYKLELTDGDFIELQVRGKIEEKNILNNINVYWNQVSSSRELIFSRSLVQKLPFGLSALDGSILITSEDVGKSFKLTIEAIDPVSTIVREVDISVVAKSP